MSVRMEITVRDEAEPFLNDLIDKNPRVVARALRWTALSHRRKMKQAMEYNTLGMDPKKNLFGKARNRFLNELTSRRNKYNFDPEKHISQSPNPFVSKKGRPPLWQALRVAVSGKNGKNANSYDFGFIGDGSFAYKFGGNKISEGVKQAAKYMNALAEGKYMTPSGRLDNSVGKRMRGYFGSTGIGMKKGTGSIDMPKRDAVGVYFARNKNSIISDFKKKFAMVLKREQERLAKKAKVKGKTRKYGTKSSQFIKNTLAS